MSVIADPNCIGFKDQLQYPLTIEGIEVTATQAATINQSTLVIDVSLNDYAHSAANTEDQKGSIHSATGDNCIIL